MLNPGPFSQGFGPPGLLLEVVIALEAKIQIVSPYLLSALPPPLPQRWGGREASCSSIPIRAERPQTDRQKVVILASFCSWDTLAPALPCYLRNPLWTMSSCSCPWGLTLLSGSWGLARDSLHDLPCSLGQLWPHAVVFQRGMLRLACTARVLSFSLQCV